MRLLLPFTLAASLATPLKATDDCGQDAMIVFDGSGSMAEMGFNDLARPRIFDAREAVAQVMPEIAAARRLGLVIYGPGGDDVCSGVGVRFTPVADAAPRIIDAVNGLEPEGSTALTRSVQLAAEVLDYENRPGAIVLVTDGKETCGGAPCALAGELAARGADLTVHVIGFKVRGAFFSWEGEAGDDYVQAETVSRCLADRTGGKYVSTETADELIAALRETLGCSLLF